MSAYSCCLLVHCQLMVGPQVQRYQATWDSVMQICSTGKVHPQVIAWFRAHGQIPSRLATVRAPDLTAVTTAIPVGCVLACRSQCWTAKDCLKSVPGSSVVPTLEDIKQWCSEYQYFYMVTEKQAADTFKRQPHIVRELRLLVARISIRIA